MQPQKKQLEILLMDYFRECYHDFPGGMVTPSESPDFVVKLNAKKQLGIELTRLNPFNAGPPDKYELKQIQTRDKIIASAQAAFEYTSPLRLFVKFLFSAKHHVTEEWELAIAARLARSIRQAVAGRHPASFFRESIPSEKLPEGLESLLVVHHPALEVSIWERSNNLGVSNNVVADIRKSIFKKDTKLGLYQKQRLNHYWLLITTDRLRGVKSYNLSGKILNHTFQSRFQKVFLFDLMRSDVFQLV
jgi:hypothetical protein